MHQNRKEWSASRPYLEQVANQQQDSDLATDAQQMLRSVDSVIAKQELQNLLNLENWKQVSKFISEQERLGNLPFNKEIFGIWVQAETKQQNWSKVLELYEKLYQRRLLVRLIGVRFSHLVNGNYQINLFEDSENTIALYNAIDRMRGRYGDRSVVRASGLGAKTIGRMKNPFNGEPPTLLAHRKQ